MKLITLLSASFLSLALIFSDNSHFATEIPICTCSRTADSSVLVELYNATDGANWITNWDFNTPIDTWNGIIINSGGCVDKINLVNNNFTGSLPTTLGNLSALTELSLSGNNISGTIPNSLGNLSQLERLLLNNNPNMTGSIPSELGSLSNLTRLDLIQNNLTGSIPSTFSNLGSLKILRLDNNLLDGDLTDIFGGLSSIEVFTAGNNLISGSIPASIGNCINLETLQLANNQLSGSIPSTIGQTSLISLKLEKNNLTDSIPPEIGDLKNLVFLQLYENQLTGTIPSSFNDLPALEFLVLYDNQLTGSIPIALNNSPNLKSIQLTSNNLTGNIPATLGQLSSLHTLRLSKNNLTGNIPSELGNAISLTVIDLLDNQLTGTIPTELGNLNQLDQLYLGSNDLTGNIPSSLGNIPILFNLSLRDNQLTGSIPSSLGQLTNLRSLDIRDNDLTGMLPTELGNLQNLENLYAEQCELSGSIPIEFGNMASLVDLWLQGNNLTGEIPAELGNLNNLKTLRLNSNELIGKIPSTLGNLPLIEEIYLDNQFLSGEIPAELGNLNTLKILNLSANEFSGEIPNELGNLSNIEEMNLGSNQLIGCIPPNFFNLCSQTINLNNNPNLFAGDDFNDFCTTGQGSCLDNYECTDAAFLPMNEDPCGRMYVAVKLELATSSIPAPSLSCNNTYIGNDVWFNAEVPATGNFLIKSDFLSTIAASVEVYAGSNCNSLSPLICAEIDSLPFVLAINGQEHNLLPNDLVYFRVWEQNNTLVDAPEEAVVVLSAHSLAADTEEWELCDFPIDILNDTLSQGAGNRIANSFIVQLESNANPQEVQEVRDVLSESATLVATCPCLKQELELWQTDDPIAMETLRNEGRVNSTRSKVDTTNYDYLLEQRITLANNNTAGQQNTAAVGINSAGDVFLAWQDLGRDGERYGVFGRRFMSNGTPSGDDFLVNSTTLGDQDAPSIAMNNVGQSVIVWMNGVDTKNIRGQVYDSNGQTLGGEFKASIGALGFNPKVAINNNNEFVVVWEGQDSDGLGIFAQQMNDDGDFIGEPITVISSIGNQLHTDVAINDAGNFAITWEDNETNVGYALYAQNPSGVQIISSVQNVGTASDIQGTPVIAMNNTGEFVIAWAIDKGNGNVDIAVRHFNPDGSFNGGQVSVLQDMPISEFDIVLDPNANFLLTWEFFSGTDTDVYLQLFDANKNPIALATLAHTTTTGAQVSPTIAINDQNDVVVAWTSYGVDGFEQGIYAQRFSIDINQGTVTPNLEESTEAGVGIAQAFSTTIYTPNNPNCNVKVAIFDTGIDSDHTQLINALWQNPETNDSDNCLIGDQIGYDFVNNDGVPDDVDGHGSSVSGMLVNDFPNNIKLDLMSMKFYENQRGTVFDAVCGIYYAVNEGAKIINLSWGFEAAQFPEILYDALKYAAERDVLIITSAGNTSKDNDLIQKYPSNFDLDNMIIVTAYQTDPDGNNIRLADYASYGATTVDIAAAGFVETTNFDGTLVKQTGTSMAAPIVARTAAILRAKYPCLTAQQIKNCILSTTDIYDSFTGRSVSGGILNHQAALNCATSKTCLRLQVKVKLQGNYNSGNGLMSNGLIESSLVPVQSPYFPTDETNTSVLQAKTAIPIQDEIVDWVTIQLRDKNNSSTILTERSALLQRDGDIVDLDGESPVRFYNLPEDEYFIAVTHRNHLSVMTNQAIMLTD